MVAHIQTETDAAKTAILDNLPTLRDRLADQGVRIERFDVDLMQRQPGGGGMPDQPGSRQQESPAPARCNRAGASILPRMFPACNRRLPRTSIRRAD